MALIILQCLFLSKINKISAQRAKKTVYFIHIRLKHDPVIQGLYNIFRNTMKIIFHFTKKKIFAARLLTTAESREHKVRNLASPVYLRSLVTLFIISIINQSMDFTRLRNNNSFLVRRMLSQWALCFAIEKARLRKKNV